MSRPRIIQIAVALITDASRRMLVVRKHGTHVFMQPGGKIDEGESPLDALERELREELCFSIDRMSAIYLGRLFAPAALESNAVVEAEAFLVTAPTMPTPHAEIAEAVWITSDGEHGLRLAPLTSDCALPLLRSIHRVA